MSQQLSLLEQLTEAGIKQALDHADREEPGWSEQAFNKLISFLSNSAFPFQTEDVREFSESNGLSKPPDSRAWGGVIRKAAKRNIIKRIGFGPTKNPLTHGGLTGIWIKNI